MKKVLIIIGGIFLFILLALFLAPILFKDKIHAAIDKQLDKNLNAQVFYDPDKFDLSLFRHFPDVTVSLEDFGIVGNAPFDKDTLAAVSSFEITVDIMSVIKDGPIEIVEIDLIRPVVNIILLEDGTANYDIAKSTATDTATNADPASIQIQEWTITDGFFVYDDRSLPMILTGEGIDHTGSGDFTQNVFDMMTHTEARSFSLFFDGIEYISDKELAADVTMDMDFDQMKFTFKENEAVLSQFAFGFEGFISMPEKDVDMNLSFSGKDIDLKSVLSLIPGVYQEYLDGVDASGRVALDGHIKGISNETSVPEIAIHMEVADGKVKYSDYPVPMEALELDASFLYPSLDLTQTSFTVDKFHMLLDGEEVSASLYFKDLEDYFWDLKLDGNLDLDKLTHVVKVEGTNLKGHVNAKIDSKGRMSDLEAGAYDKLPTSGTVKLDNFYYSNADVAQAVSISQASLSLSPEAIMINSFQGKAGNTDMNLTGKITNYLQYIMNDSAMIRGNMAFNSQLVDINEWMVESPDTAEVAPPTEAIRIPQNIDFALASDIKSIRYDNLNLQDFKGNVIIKDGTVKLERAGFNLLDGKFEISGTYESAPELAQPLFNFDFDVAKLSIPKAFQSFLTIQKLAPIAEKMKGEFNTDFALNGALSNDMLPILSGIHGAGLIKIANATVEDVKVLDAIGKFTSLGSSPVGATLRDVIMSAEIKDGRIHVDPFDVSLWGRDAIISGSTGLDGSLDYKLSMDVPSGQIGQTLNSAISSIAGIDNLVGDNVTINLGIKGFYNDPKVNLLSAKPGGKSAEGGVKAALKQEATKKIEETKAEIKKEVEVKKDSAINEVKQEVNQQVEETKQEAKDEVQKKAKDALKGVFGK